VPQRKLNLVELAVRQVAEPGAGEQRRPSPPTAPRDIRTDSHDAGTNPVLSMMPVERPRSAAAVIPNASHNVTPVSIATVKGPTAERQYRGSNSRAMVLSSAIDSGRVRGGSGCEADLGG
jgi:hypothetical protein